MINNILDFSRIESGRKAYAFADTDLAALVDVAELAPGRTKPGVRSTLPMGAVKPPGQAATAEGVYPTKYKCKMTGEQGDKLEIMPILPVETL